MSTRHIAIRAVATVDRWIAALGDTGGSQALDIHLEYGPIVVKEIRGAGFGEVEGSDQEGRHLSPCDTVVRAEAIVRWWIAAFGDARRRQRFDVRLEYRVVIIDERPAFGSAWSTRHRTDVAVGNDHVVDVEADVLVGHIGASVIDIQPDLLDLQAVGVAPPPVGLPVRLAPINPCFENTVVDPWGIEHQVLFDAVPAILFQEPEIAVLPQDVVAVDGVLVGVIDIVADRNSVAQWVVDRNGWVIAAPCRPAVGSVGGSAPPTGNTVGPGDAGEFTAIGWVPALVDAYVVAEVDLGRLGASLILELVADTHAGVGAGGNRHFERGTIDLFKARSRPDELQCRRVGATFIDIGPAGVCELGELEDTGMVAYAGIA